MSHLIFKFYFFIAFLHLSIISHSRMVQYTQEKRKGVGGGGFGGWWGILLGLP